MFPRPEINKAKAGGRKCRLVRVGSVWGWATPARQLKDNLQSHTGTPDEAGSGITLQKQPSRSKEPSNGNGCEPCWDARATRQGFL